MTGRAGTHGCRSALHAVVGALVLALAAACSSSTSTAAAPPAATAGSAPTSAPSIADRGAAAVAAYRGMWADFAQAATTSDWQSPSLGQHATGVALTNLSRALYADHLNGYVTRGQPVLKASVQSVEPATGDPTKVVVADCADSTKALKYHLKGGEPVGGGGGLRRITGIVDRQKDGSWKVSDYAVQDLGSC